MVHDECRPKAVAAIGQPVLGNIDGQIVAPVGLEGVEKPLRVQFKELIFCGDGAFGNPGFIKPSGPRGKTHQRTRIIIDADKI